MKNCPKCNKVHSKPGTFCSRSCANSREHSAETRAKISASIANYQAKHGHLGTTNPDGTKKENLKFTKPCKLCGKPVVVWPCNADRKKYCSRECHRKDPNAKRAKGGYRKGSGHSKSGYYKGIYCDSTWELCWVIWALDNGVAFTRFPKMLKGEKINYLPDFLLGDGKTIIEIKGYENKARVKKKTALAESKGYSVKVLRRPDLQDAFDHVTKKFGTTNFKTLYDDYAPRFTYECSHCGTEVKRDRRKKTEKVYCSPQCSMKANHYSRQGE